MEGEEKGGKTYVGLIQSEGWTTLPFGAVTDSPIINNCYLSHISKILNVMI